MPRESLTNPRASTTTSRGEVPSWTGQAVVLLLDDELPVRQSLGRYLALHGFAVVETATADGALECLQKYAIDAFILDVRLPAGRSGLEVLQSLRLDRGHADRPVIVLTGNVLTEDEEQVIRQHGAYVFYKPHGYGEVVTHLRQLCPVARCA